MQHGFGWWPFRQRADVWSDGQPIRAELFGLERFREHAASLARSQPVCRDAIPVTSVVTRLQEDARSLADSYEELCRAVTVGQPITPAAEWLVDNYYIIEQHVRQATIDLPPGYYRQLPKLSAGPLLGHPRIFGIAWAYVAHTDSRFDGHVLTDFVNAYQEVQPLTIGELWATAISLRLVLIENLTRISRRTIESRRARSAADELAEKLLEGKLTLVDLHKALEVDMAEHAKLAFTVQLIKRLRDQDTIDAAVIDAIRVSIHAHGLELDSAVAEGHSRQAAANVTMRNLVTSLRHISDYAWEEWFDHVSLVDKLLAAHPAYPEMDFRTRNSYRSAIEDLSRHSKLDELTITRRVLNACGVQEHGVATSGDPGYHLIGQGRSAFEAGISYRRSLNRRISETVRRAGLAGYIAAIAVITLVCLIVGLWPLATVQVSVPLLLLLAAISLVPVIEVAMSLANFTVTHVLRPVVLPALALRNGVPTEFRTLVAVPTMLVSAEEIEELVERLEIHYLANPDGELYFALVTDWADAATQHVSDDDELLSVALNGIHRLNEKYPDGRFLLLHRARRWNEVQGKWMGWERKRGKLLELNKLLRGAIDTSFIVVGGKLPAGFRFVLTLDADTKLPRNAARRLVGKLAHPLNRPFFDKEQGRVTYGYGLLQPRVTPTLPVDDYGTIFQSIFSTRRGTDPYVFATSDVYQDLFGEGSYAGKGIYDIDAFEAALANRVPENAMLSHDLFEGIFARAALVSDIEVVEEFPERYAVACARQHRWVRGDWQLLPWIAGSFKIISRQGREAIPAVGLWKMLDNLRRSLMPVFAFASLFVAWLSLSFAPAAAWTAFLVLVMFLPAFIPMYSGSHLRPAEETVRSQINLVARETAQALVITAANLTFLAHQASLAVDAVTRTLYRLYVSRKNLLEWTAAAQVQSAIKPALRDHYALMLPSVIAALAILAVAAWWQNGVAAVALPFAALWLAAPAIAWVISKPRLATDELAASPQDRLALRLVARRTWTFFEAFVTAEDNMLPPDNFQEDPAPVVAHRTSPTNIGLYLLAAANARDFGWLGLGDALNRIEATLATIDRMERYRGHLFNWYDTRSLTPLEPRYVSTVDSGNFAGHLIALSNICQSWSTAIPANVEYLEGIGDCAEILREEIATAAEGGTKTSRQIAKGILQQIRSFHVSLQKARTPAELIPVRLIELAVQAGALHTSANQLSEALAPGKAKQVLYWVSALQNTIESQFKDASLDDRARSQIRKRLDVVMAKTRNLALEMEFAFLADPQRQLMAVGFRASDSTLDGSCYDMLASEAALASYLAIAKGDLSARHWFRLARPVTSLSGGAALVSWSGSMFEYLMPLLVLQMPHGSLLDQTARLIVRRQIAYAGNLRIPWGISESAFSARDRNFTYQYSNFGVPGLGLKHGLSDNMVVAPYATGLAAMISPRAAASNFAALRNAGVYGPYGFYEAIDYTQSRLRPGEAYALVKAYFAHHQGMTIAAIYNAVSNGSTRMQFHRDPLVRATELLLQERAPRRVPLKLLSVAATDHERSVADSSPPAPLAVDPWTAAPSTCLLSNGQYSVMMTASGSGFSTWKNISINRWREDPVCDDYGNFVFLRDMASKRLWTAGYMPLVAMPDSYEAKFSEEKVEIHRTDGLIATSMECIVSTEDNAEARHILFVNNSSTMREIEITTYAELALATASADQAHQAFSKLFVTTEFVADLGVLLAARRKRLPTDPDVWVAQFMVVDGTVRGELEFETDRARFLGRGNELHSADALEEQHLSGTQGTVLDPVFSLRQRLRIPPGRQASCTIWTVAAESRADALEIVDRHCQHAACERAKVLAWSYSRIQLRHLSIEASEANLFQRLASYLIYAGSTLRPPSPVLQVGMRNQRQLWSTGISGEKPILLLRIDAVEDLEIVHQLLQAHEYWNSKHFAVDLVFLNEKRASYIQDLQLAIEELIRKSTIDPHRTAHGGSGQAFALRSDILPQDTLAMLPAVARVVLHARSGTLPDQLLRLRSRALPPRTSKRPPHELPTAGRKPLEAGGQGLAFFNGFGGFDRKAGEYVIFPSHRNPTPAPWINVIANPHFGMHCSAEGPGFTWSGNSRECQITPWLNDAVSNRPSEVLYIRDQRTGRVTSPCLAPLFRGSGSYRTRHGFGYSVYGADDAGLSMELLQFVPLADTIKLERLRVAQNAAGSRQLTVTFYADLVLGSRRAGSAPYVSTEIDAETGALFVHNKWNEFFGGRVVFVDLCGAQVNWSGDRQHFIGRYGSLASPRAIVDGEGLSNTTGAGLDPCAALQAKITLKDAATEEVRILVGSAADEAEARALIGKYRNADFDAVLSEVKNFWRETLGAIEVATPDPAFDLVINGWLLYQALACRMFGRAGFYQASGAYGMRDQLQDSMALAVVRPEIAREHVLRAVGRQFLEGDLQHWWLPDSGVGVRTRISDDTVWLAYCVHHYVKVTGDTGVLDEQVPFLEGRQLEAEEHEAYFEPIVSAQTASVYAHCALALDRSLAVGGHGLPLFGTGDWNDGMNRVGEHGKGESVWLGWFLYSALGAFRALAAARGDTKHAEAWKRHMEKLSAAIEAHGWDGQWYRRGYFDDGTPLGSAQNDECRIDSIAQSWAVLSGAGDSGRAEKSLNQSYEQLVKADDGLALLFAPPFDKSLPDPGYIKAYPPGIRENGGQYTHGAIWSVFAHAKRNDSERAGRLFSLLNPINHALTKEDALRYRVEPYVVAADIYSVGHNRGRGGWTWYTGAAGWLYRAGLEAILGMSREGDILRIKPCIPPSWPGFSLRYRFGNTSYDIEVSQDGKFEFEDTEDVERLSSGEYLIQLRDMGGTTSLKLVLDKVPDEKSLPQVSRLRSA